MDLKQIGWDDKRTAEFMAFSEKGFSPARVAAEYRERYTVLSECGEMEAEVTGRFIHLSEDFSEFPKTGDWVAVSVFKDENKAIIHEVLERNTVFSRSAAGEKTQEQVIAANIDCVFIVQGLDNNYNPARLQRYAAAVSAAKGIEPVIVLNKSDIGEKIGEKTAEINRLLPGVRVMAVSAKNGRGFDELEKYIQSRKTYAFTGSSGAGKSSIINRLAGENLAGINEVREKDSKGRHTTTARQLFVLKNGGLVIDTPGMRGLGLWVEKGAAVSGYEEIEKAAEKCRFSDCTHETEPGCAVRDAIEKGLIDKKRFEAYKKLQREAFHIKAKTDEKAAIEKKKKDKEFGRMVKSVMKQKKARKRY